VSEIDRLAPESHIEIVDIILAVGFLICLVADDTVEVTAVPFVNELLTPIIDITPLNFELLPFYVMAAVI